MGCHHFVVLSILAFQGINGFNNTHRLFPSTFTFGVATASYQIEGAWDEADKGENIWDHISHTSSLVYNGDTGDVACDSYHQYERDVEMLIELGVDFYRFSFSWSRLLPSGFDNKISEDGMAYYNKLIDLLIANGITPYGTLYHWDLPQPLQDIGGWPNPLLEEYFVNYARIVFDAFGDRVKNWMTFNEPHEICQSGYGMDGKAPALNFTGVASYLCGHTLLKAHARAYHLYDDEFRPIQNGRIGFVLNANWCEPEDPMNVDDVRAAEIAQQFFMGWFAHPVYSETGDYPEIFKSKIDEKSREQGYSSSRLPKFTAEEVEYIRGTADFYGYNAYTAALVRAPRTSDVLTEESVWYDSGVILYKPSDWEGSPASPWLKVTPWGFYKLIMWITNSFNKPEILITENGYSDLGGIEDSDRINYFHLYLNALLDAIEDGANVTAYTAWSLMDNFEWLAGYHDRFGLYQVDYEDPDRTRTPKQSASYYSSIATTKLLERTYVNVRTRPN